MELNWISCLSVIRIMGSKISLFESAKDSLKVGTVSLDAIAGMKGRRSEDICLTCRSGKSAVFIVADGHGEINAAVREFVRALVRFVADLAFATKRGKTPLEWASVLKTKLLRELPTWKAACTTPMVGASIAVVLKKGDEWVALSIGDCDVFNVAGERVNLHLWEETPGVKKDDEVATKDRKDVRKRFQTSPLWKHVWFMGNSFAPRNPNAGASRSSEVCAAAAALDVLYGGNTPENNMLQLELLGGIHISELQKGGFILSSDGIETFLKARKPEEVRTFARNPKLPSSCYDDVCILVGG